MTNFVDGMAGVIGLNRLNTTGQDGNRNGDIADGDQNGDHFGGEFQPGRIDRMAEAERLKHAPQSVIEVIAEHDHGNDVKERDRPNLKTVHDVVVHVVGIEGTARMDGAEGEVEQVEDEESEDDRAAPHHGARSVGRGNVGFFDISDGTRFFLEEPQLERGPDVKDDGEKECEASAPERAGMGLEKLGVMIDFFGWLVDLQVAEQVADDKAEENKTRDGHDGFLADSGLPETKRARRKRDSRSAHGIHQSLMVVRIKPRRKKRE